MPTKALLHGPLTEAGQQIADKIRKKLDGHPTLFEPSIRRNPKMPDTRTCEQTVTARYGMSWNRRSELWLIPWKPPRAGAVIDKMMRTKYAACAALGLSYWCEGFQGHIVAVDNRQRFVDVKINQKDQTAYTWGRPEVRFTVGDTAATLDLLATDQPTGPVGSTHSATVPEPEKPAAIDRLTVQRAIAHIRHDGSYVTDTETAILQHIAAKAKYYNGGRDIVPLVTAELGRRKLAIA
ncbi:DUF7457 domain-containing protein [Mycobacteroides abscessus]